MSDIRTIKFVYSSLMGFDPWIGTYLVEGEEYKAKYEESQELTMSMPIPTGGYRISDEGNLIRSTKIQISGDSYMSINRTTGEMSRIDSRYVTSIDRYDKNGRDLIDIIKKSIIEWMYLK